MNSFEGQKYGKRVNRTNTKMAREYASVPMYMERIPTDLLGSVSLAESSDLFRDV